MYMNEHTNIYTRATIVQGWLRQHNYNKELKKIYVYYFKLIPKVLIKKNELVIRMVFAKHMYIEKCSNSMKSRLFLNSFMYIYSLLCFNVR